ncbi:MAG: aspartyl protease family protein [Acidobacteriia bacterium]|nr:aspartyl protease family protein [Terriglobia bacterium]
MRSYLLFLFFLLAFCFTMWGQEPATTNAKPASSAAAASPEADSLKSAQALLRERKYEEAATAFQAIVEKSPQSADARAGLIRSLMRSSRNREAEQAGKNALAAIPSSALISATVGDVAFREGKFGEAEAAYRGAVKLDNKSARAWFGMGLIYDMVSMHKQAKNAFAHAHDLDPDDGQISQHWRAALPYAERLEAAKKAYGGHPSEDEQEEIKFLAAVAAKKPFVLASEIKPTEIKMLPYGKELVGINQAASVGAVNISKGYGLQLKFNGRVGAVLLLDTGAGGIIIGRKLAEKVGVVKIAETTYSGIGKEGPIKSYLGWVDKINIGNVEFHDYIVEVSSRTDINDEAGLIGADVFEKFLVTLDFKEWKMFLNPLPKNPNASGNEDEPQDRYIAPEMQSYAKIFRFGHDLVIPVLVSDSVNGNFILDTGAMMNTISPLLMAQITKLSNEGDTVKGVSGSMKVLTGDKATLQFAKVRVRSDDIPAVPINMGSTEIAGLIGIKTLVQMKMTIDYRDGLVNLEVYNFRPARE